MPGTRGRQARIDVSSRTTVTCRIVQDPARRPAVRSTGGVAARAGRFRVRQRRLTGPEQPPALGVGCSFGFRRTVPHIVGTAAGIGGMALGVAAGLGTLITTVPEIAFVMKLAGSAYLLALAWQVAGAQALARASIARPIGMLQAAALQLINPKAWIFALGAMTTFPPENLPPFAGTVLVATTMVFVILPSAAIWAGGGELLDRLVSSERVHRTTSLVLAVILVATVVSVWV